MVTHLEQPSSSSGHFVNLLCQRFKLWQSDRHNMATAFATAFATTTVAMVLNVRELIGS